MKKTIDDVEVSGRRVLVRLDLNVPLDSHQRITDDRRIRSAVPTVRRLAEGGGRVILMSHLGRPKGASGDRRRYSLAPVAERLAERLERAVPLAGDCVGPKAKAAVAELSDGDVCVLENLRFHDAETIKDAKAVEDESLRDQKHAFARELVSMADMYVNDAFGTCHRDNASMLAVPRLMEGKPRVVGYLVQRELKYLGDALAHPDRPFVCVLGGAKVSDKLGVIRSLMTKCDTILIGGAMAYTFLAAEGMNVGKSLVEPNLFETARQLRSEAGDRIKLPMDSVAAPSMERPDAARVCASSIADALRGLDIGPRTVEAFGRLIASAKTVFWNGPMGVFEVPPFDMGTVAIAAAMADATDGGATTIVGGGDSAAAIEQAGLADRVTHISTGGGASLALLEGEPFAAIDALDDA